MAYGMQIYDKYNTLAYDSTSPGGVFVQYIIMPAGTTGGNSSAPNYVYFPLDWAPGAYIPGGPQRGRDLVVMPLVTGSHIWSVEAGYYEAGQQPAVSWYNDPYIPPGLSRAATILMVFVK